MKFILVCFLVLLLLIITEFEEYGPLNVFNTQPLDHSSWIST